MKKFILTILFITLSIIGFSNDKITSALSNECNMNIKEYKFQVYDLLGREINDISNLEKGLYIIKLYNEEEIIYKKLSI